MYVCFIIWQIVDQPIIPGYVSKELEDLLEVCLSDLILIETSGKGSDKATGSERGEGSSLVQRS